MGRRNDSGCAGAKIFRIPHQTPRGTAHGLESNRPHDGAAFGGGCHLNGQIRFRFSSKWNWISPFRVTDLATQAPLKLRLLFPLELNVKSASSFGILFSRDQTRERPPQRKRTRTSTVTKKFR